MDGDSKQPAMVNREKNSAQQSTPWQCLDLTPCFLTLNILLCRQVLMKITNMQAIKATLCGFKLGLSGFKTTLPLKRINMCSLVVFSCFSTEDCGPTIRVDAVHRSNQALDSILQRQCSVRSARWSDLQHCYMITHTNKS